MSITEEKVDALAEHMARREGHTWSGRETLVIPYRSRAAYELDTHAMCARLLQPEAPAAPESPPGAMDALFAKRVECEELKEQLAVELRHVKTAMDRVDGAYAEVDAVKAEGKRLKGEVADLMARRAKEARDWIEVHGERDAARAELAAVRAEADDAHSTCEQLRVELRAAEDVADKRYGDIRDLSYERDVARNELAAMRSQLARLREPQWSEAVREAVRATTSLWWDHLNQNYSFAALAGWRQEELVGASREVVEAYLAALASEAKR